LKNSSKSLKILRKNLSFQKWKNLFILSENLQSISFWWCQSCSGEVTGSLRSSHRKEDNRKNPPSGHHTVVPQQISLLPRNSFKESEGSYCCEIPKSITRVNLFETWNYMKSFSATRIGKNPPALVSYTKRNTSVRILVGTVGTGDCKNWSNR